MVQANLGAQANPDPARASYAHLIDAFGRAWESGRPAAIAEVFTLDGALVPSPFDLPIRGRAAIEEYWRDVPKEQAEISFRFGEIFIAGPWFATEFKCSYRRIKTGAWIEVSGALFCETVVEKITEMRMYWDRSRQAR